MIAIGLNLELDEEIIKAAIGKFESVERRFTVTGKVGSVTVIDDYAHHPTEIAAVLKAARDINENGKVIAVFQPHRFSRIKSLMEKFSTCFNDADTVIVSDIYPAGEKPIPGIDRISVVDNIRSHGHRRVLHLSDPDILPELIRKEITAKNIEYTVICLGAGTVTKWAHSLPIKLQEILQ